jgi:hypothetical protein
MAWTHVTLTIEGPPEDADKLVLEVMTQAIRCRRDHHIGPSASAWTAVAQGRWRERLG